MMAVAHDALLSDSPDGVRAAVASDPEAQLAVQVGKQDPTMQKFLNAIEGLPGALEGPRQIADNSGGDFGISAAIHKIASSIVVPEAETIDLPAVGREIEAVRAPLGLPQPPIPDVQQ